MAKINFTSYWSDEPKFEAHQACLNTVESIINDQARKYEDMKRYATLYKDETVVGFDPGEYRKAYDDFEEAISYNVVRSCTDALTSKITMNKPAPRFLTQAGTEDLQEKAKQQEKFVGAVLQTEQVYDKAQRTFRDACIYGHGVLKVLPMDGKVTIEVIHPSRIVVDNNACLDRPPRTVWQKTYMDKSQLLELFPKSKDAIEDVKVRSVSSSSSLVRDLVEVWEVWKLGTEEHPGRHMIFSENTTFLDESWTDDRFPFCIIKFSDDVMGWFGIGLAEQLEGIQVEINELLRKIQTNMNLLAVPYVLKERGSDVHDEHIMSNEDARLIEYTGPNPPQIITPPAANPQVFQHLETLYQRAFEIAGISQLSATSQKPAGLNSGVAIRTFHDVETQRFAVIARRWEQLFVELAKRIIDCARGLVNSEEGYEVRFVNKDTLEHINFLDIDLDEAAYVLQVYPASSLPQTPAGRLQTVVDLMQGQMITPEEGRQLLDFPDLEKSNRLATASLDDLEATFEHMLGKGKYIEPLPFQDLVSGIKLGVSYYLRAKMDGIRQERLDLVLRWLDEASNMLQPPPPPVMPVPVAPVPPAEVEGVAIPGAAQPLPQELPEVAPEEAIPEGE
jgi:hypothetical protein